MKMVHTVPISNVCRCHRVEFSNFLENCCYFRAVSSALCITLTLTLAKVHALPSNTLLNNAIYTFK